MKVLITGANGFIGRSLCASLNKKDYYVCACVRNHINDIIGVDEYVEVGNIGPETDWSQALTEVDIIIHLAARVHIMHEVASNSLESFRKINVAGTERLAQMAVRTGVKRFIFISSVKVNGEGALRPYTENDIPEPKDAYGISKYEAENILMNIAAETGLKVVILRTPLVYGPGVKANVKNLIKIAGSRLPLPFKGINNRRSFLYIGNLLDAIMTCAKHAKAAGQTFMVSDGQDISTPDLVRMIADVMEIKGDSHKNFSSHLRLFYLNPGILKALCKVAGKSEELNKVIGTLAVDSSKIRDLLGWSPLFTLEEGIKQTIKG